jgi:hypothetical protein
MIGTQLIEELVQSVALSHRIKNHPRVSLLLLAAPESGKTTISTAANCQHVCRIALISGRSILREIREHPKTEFILFNDLASIRALSPSASALLITLLNQLTQNERGIVGFAGKDTEQITREIGIIGCIPYGIFVDHRARWKEMGFVSRMIPFAYSYSAELIAEIKNSVDNDVHFSTTIPRSPMPRVMRNPVTATVPGAITRSVRALADARSASLKQIGIRLLKNYHALIRAHALLKHRTTVNETDLVFLRAVDSYVSITECRELQPELRHVNRSQSKGAAHGKANQRITDTPIHTGR